jgi:hypothetical protein
MKINEILKESLSRVVYHYTNLHSASKIVESGEFQLSSSLGSVEEFYAPKGYHYFLSTTRTLTGGYHEYVSSSGAVMFVLDGNWFNHHYKSGPVDYWGNRDPLKLHHKAHEAEDRIYAKTPTIPLEGVTAIHILIKPGNTNENSGGWARTTIIGAKRRGIKTYLYSDESAWRLLDTTKSNTISGNPQLRGQQNTRGSSRSLYKPKGYLYPWVQLITATAKNQLSPEADKLRYSLQYTYDAQGALQGLSNEMSNARKPSAGADRDNATKIIEYMRSNGINDMQELVSVLSDKWKKLSTTQ